MPAGVPMVKGHAYGNDFLLVHEKDFPSRDVAALARAACKRHEGIGADGLMIYAEAGSALRIRLFNADGSESEVSGNGIRCLAALAVRGRPDVSEVVIETPAGKKILQLLDRQADGATFRAAMGEPSGIRQVSFEAAGQTVQAVTLSVGNPQCVVLERALSESRMRDLGPAIEHHAMFPARTNVSFAHVERPDRVRVLIWERGVGPTQASGTGACGAAVAAAVFGGASRDVEVVSPGGSQQVQWRDDGLYLTGWAKLVWEGAWLGGP